VPPKDPLQLLTAARLTVVAGKGGVGKTTVTAVIARAAAARGLRVLVVELDGKPGLATLLGSVSGTEAREVTRDVGDGEIPLLSLTPQDALQEYLDTHGLTRVARRLVSTGVIDVVATAAPGIDDIVVLGKLKQLERSGEWDLVLVDGPAAGHALTMLLAPAGFTDAVRSGPVRTQAVEVAEMLADPVRSQVVLVTLPETTPVNELVEAAYALEERVGVQLGPVVVNGVDAGDPLALDGAPEGSALRAAAEFRNSRRELHRGELARLVDLLALPQLHLAHVDEAIDAAVVRRLAEAWGAT
jgi:anion-transporting  ArsA/GET3 family ATPase